MGLMFTVGRNSFRSHEEKWQKSYIGRTKCIMGYMLFCVLLIQLMAVESIKSHPVEKQAYRNESVRDILYNFPWHLGKRSESMTDLYMGPHHLSKRDPSADPGGVSLSVTANMDTLRQRLLWSLQNNHRQFGRVDLHSAG